MYMLCRKNVCHTAQLTNFDEKTKTRAPPTFQLSPPTAWALHQKHELPCYLPLYPYLTSPFPPQCPSPISLWILSHTLDSLLSLIKHCLFLQMSLRCGLWTVDAPGTQQRPERACGLASDPSYPRLQPWRDRLHPSSTMLDSLHTNTHHKYRSHQHAIEA